MSDEQVQAQLRGLAGSHGPMSTRGPVLASLASWASWACEVLEQRHAGHLSFGGEHPNEFLLAPAPEGADNRPGVPGGGEVQGCDRVGGRGE